MSARSVLKLDLNVGQSVQVGHNVTITLEKKTGQIGRLSFEADRNVIIRRVEPQPVRKKVYGVTGEYQ